MTKRYTISELARACGLSRATLLYYDRIGLLPSPGRTASGYRVYGGGDLRRLQKIRRFREMGLAIADIQRLLDGKRGPFAAILKKRLNEIGGQIVSLKKQQSLLAGMLKSGGAFPVVDKAQWVAMLRRAGMDEAGMARWHREFERHSPEDHHVFLLSLGIPEAETRAIRRWAQ